MGYHDEVANDKLTYQIIEVALDVHTHLGSDLPEKIYRDAFCHGLQHEKFHVEREKEVTVTYLSRPFGVRYIDLLVEEQVVIELKAVSRLTEEHFKQLGANVKFMNKRRGLLINFGTSRIQVRRFANDQHADAER